MKEIILVASGDSRPSANITCWPAQQQMETKLAAAFAQFGIVIKRAHHYDEDKKHGLIDGQKMGMQVFATIDENAPLIVAESLWQYSHHVLAGLTTHKGPILTVANWSGQWPGLVGLLNLNASLTKAGVHYSTIWSENFDDDFFINGIKDWIERGEIKHNSNQVKEFNFLNIPSNDAEIGIAFAKKFRKNKAIMGVLDEGCMGMYNAIIPDEILHKTGVFKERLSQCALYAEMLLVSDTESETVLQWLLQAGLHFDWGVDEATDLTRNQTTEQCKMYIAVVRMAHHFGCDTIGIQYQQGLKDICASSDLVEGLLNNKERPPVYDIAGNILFAGEAIPHFNEVDECAGLDALVTYKLWNALGMSGENTLHDLRWGQDYVVNGKSEFVWVFLISGAAPAAHFIDGYKSASSERQPAMFFPKGGGTLKGISKPGVIVWSRIYVMDNCLHSDMGIGTVVDLPIEETNRRWQQTTSEWPIMHAIINGVSRDQMMARHKSNHIQVVYATNLEMANKACHIKASVLNELGIKVSFCGL